MSDAGCFRVGFMGDGPVRPQIPAAVLLWALWMARVLGEPALAAVKALVRSRARAALGVSPAFGDDALSCSSPIIASRFNFSDQNGTVLPCSRIRDIVMYSLIPASRAARRERFTSGE
jgi:hypothetical protein